MTVIEGGSEPSSGDATPSGENPVCSDVVAPMTVGPALPLDLDAGPGPRVTARPVAAWGWARLMAGFSGALLSVSYAMLEPSATQTWATQAGPLRAPVHRQVTFTGIRGRSGGIARRAPPRIRLLGRLREVRCRGNAARRSSCRRFRRS